MTARISIPTDELSAFCERWSVVKLALFGSVLRDDFGPDSDIDVLVRFDASSHHALYELDEMEEELKKIFGRDVDLVSWRGIEKSKNYLRRQAILQSAEVIYGS